MLVTVRLALGAFESDANCYTAPAYRLEWPHACRIFLACSADGVRTSGIW